MFAVSEKVAGNRTGLLSVCVCVCMYVCVCVLWTWWEAVQLPPEIPTSYSWDLWKTLKEMRIPDHLICLLRNLYAGQEATELDMEHQTSSK